MDADGVVVTTDRFPNTYEQYSQKLQQLVSITSHDDSAVTTALGMLDEMDRHPNLCPDIHIYNKVLQICAYSSNNATTVMDTMEQIIRQRISSSSLNDDNDDGDHHPVVNDVTYSILAEGYLQRHQFQKVVEMMEELRTEKPHILTTTVLNKLIKGYGQTRQPKRAMETLEYMLEQSANDIAHRLYPNRKSWVHVLRAFAVSNDASRHETCRKLWERMKQKDPQYVDTQTYNACLQGLSDHPKIAEQTLYEMIANQIIPNEESFFHVLRALRKSKDTQGLCFKAEQFLNLLKSFDMPITDRVRSMAIAVMARDSSRDSQKAKKAHQLYLTLEKNNKTPTTTTFATTQVLRACSLTQGNNHPDKGTAFQIAQALFESIPEHHYDSPIIVEYLRAVANLVDDPRKQNAYASQAFDMACQKGIVNNAVLKQFQRTASEQLVLKTFGGFLEDGIHFPLEWSQNVVQR